MSNRLRVAMLSKASIVGIYQRKLEEIARHDIELLALVPPYWRDERGKMPLERTYTEGYQLDTLEMRLNGNFHFHFYRGLMRRLRAFKPHILHIDEEPYNLAAWQAMLVARRIKAKTVVFSWQNILRKYPMPFRWGERWVLRNTDALIAGTQSAADVWRAKGYRGTIDVIPQFGTDISLFKPPEKREIRPFTIGYFGRLVEEKGLRVLLDAVAQLSGDWRVRFIGGGPQLNDLQNHAERLKISHRVQFIGQIPSVNMPAQYHQLDVFVLPSLTRPNWKEQFGRVLTEAMASGVAVIGSDSGAIPGVIGEAGVVVPEGDAGALAHILNQLQQDTALRAHLALMGVDRAEKHFTHERIAEETVTVYRSLSPLD